MSIKKSSQHVAINSHFIRSKTITGTNWGVSVSPAPAYSYQETPNSICRNQLVFKTKGSMKKKLERSKLFREMLRTSSLRVCMVQSNLLNPDVVSPTHVQTVSQNCSHAHSKHCFYEGFDLFIWINQVWLYCDDPANAFIFNSGPRKTCLDTKIRITRVRKIKGRLYLYKTYDTDCILQESWEGPG